MSRSAFHPDISLGNYREELLKSKETLMMTHGTARTPSKTSEFKFGPKASPRSARTFQFGGGNSSVGGGGSGGGIGSGGGGGESGDYTKTEPNNYDKAKESNNEYRDRSTCHNFERNSDGHIFSNSSDKIGLRRGRENAFQRCNTENKKVSLQSEQKMQMQMQTNNSVEDILANTSGVSGGAYDGTFDNLDDEWEANKNLAYGKSSTTKLENISDAIEEALYGSPRSVNNAAAVSATAVGATPLLSTFSTPPITTTTMGIDMNFVVFFGLLMGIAGSKFIQLINHYFAWLLGHVLQIRNFILGPYSLADLLNFDDGSRFSLRQKLILLPLISLCCLVYSFVSIFNSLLRVSLNPAPKRLVGLLQKWQTNQLTIR